MAVGSLPVLLRRTPAGAAGQGVRALRPAALATFLMTGGVMAYGYLAHRYTSEFVPALVLGSIDHALGAGGPLGRGLPGAAPWA